MADLPIKSFIIFTDNHWSPYYFVNHFMVNRGFGWINYLINRRAINCNPFYLISLNRKKRNFNPVIYFVFKEEERNKREYIFTLIKN
jgi:hypothetical protein